MLDALHSHQFLHLSGLFIATLWLFHGIHSKIFNGIPRHRQIVAKILGAHHAKTATIFIGLLETLVGIWVLSDWQRPACALVQTLALVSMNALEICYARELLVSAIGMLLLNTMFLALVWNWALHPLPA